MISHSHGNDPYSQSGCGARGEAANRGNSRLTAAIARFHGGHVRAVWARAEADAKADAETDAAADIETCSFDFRACVVP
jgi:hypothetical protein